jgi:hypothetical protein
MTTTSRIGRDDAEEKRTRKRGIDAALTMGLLQAGELAVVGVDEGEEELAMVTMYWLAGAASSVSSLLVSSGSNSPVEDADVPAKQLLCSARRGGGHGECKDGQELRCSLSIALSRMWRGKRKLAAAQGRAKREGLGLRGSSLVWKEISGGWWGGG